MGKEQKITTDIKVPNKNREVLKKHFGQCFDKNGNFDIEKFKQELSENEIDFYKESYGLDWLGKSYARILASDEATTLLKEDEEHNQKDENKDSQNLLIKGDNLEVLKHLSNAYYEKIKMIYIDPPYNTGSDGFVYQDDRKFSVSEIKQLAGVDEEKAKRILDFTQSKSNSHSAWLTFMYPRLYIAKQLLSDDGVIFVSIDDNEVSELRLLMDEIFGEENFRGMVTRPTGTPSGQGNDILVNEIDYLLVYSKSFSAILQGLPFSESDEKIYDQEDEYGRYLTRPLRKTGGEDRQEDRPSMYYPIKSPDGDEIYPIGPTGYNSRWRCGEDTYKSLIVENRIEWKKSDNVWKPYQKFYLEGRLKQPSDLWLGIEGNKKGSLTIKNLFNEKVFETAKPVELIDRCIRIATNQTDIILDFFAGSGTTGDAVMQINAVDGGARKHFLVQLPELIDKKKSKTAYDFVKGELGITEPTIFEITKERLIRASKKIKKETIASKIADKEKEITELNGKLDLDNKEEKIQQLKAEIESLKNQDLGFRIFETTPIWDDYGFEADELNEQLNLFDESTLSEDDIKALLITWKTYDGTPLVDSFECIVLSGNNANDYTGYYSNGKLYLMHKGFLTEHLKNLLEKIDTDATFNPTSIVAFGYNFDSKNLREISENIKSYTNKKNIDIDFIMRY